jgi:hypothetical protein
MPSTPRPHNSVTAAVSAAVFRVQFDPKRAVAVKILHEQNRDDAVREGLRRGRGGKRSTERGACPDWPSDGTAYIVMECSTAKLRGDPAEGKLASDVVTKIAIRYALVLAFAHDAINATQPENIMLVLSARRRRRSTW